MNSRGWYTPVVFAYVTVFTGLLSRPERLTVHPTLETKAPGSRPPPVPGAPNVIFIQHESLSGSILLDTAAGRRATPFLQDRLRHDPHLYVFEHARAVSGNSVDALPALLTGCLPYTDAGAAWARAPGRALGREFARGLGYRTGSFSSRRLGASITAEGGPLHALHDPLVGAMDAVFEPGGLGWPADNGEGCDDRKMVRQLRGWLADLDNATGTDAHSPKEARAPFYAQFYAFNTHYPYLADRPALRPPVPGVGRAGRRYYASLATLDDFLRDLFDVLAETGRLANTVVAGAGATGEDPFRGPYVRLAAYTSHVLQPAAYLYYPRHLMPDPRVGERLRRNTQQTVSTLDLFPTLYAIAHGGGGNHAAAHLSQQHFHAGCVTGVDLTSVDVPDDRVALSWNAASAGPAKRPPENLWALHARDPATGARFSLYHRRSFSGFAALKQGKNDFYQLLYGPCLRDTSRANLCTLPRVREQYDAHVRRAIGWIKRSQGFFGEGVKSSELVEFFAASVGWEETEAPGSVSVDVAPAAGAEKRGKERPRRRPFRRKKKIAQGTL